MPRGAVGTSVPQADCSPAAAGELQSSRQAIDLDLKTAR